jgi:AcrR family transcriptional regulator
MARRADSTARRAAPNPEPRRPLSRERVLRAALALADRGGLDSLSMRRIAEELGVEAMSLYYHVANKDAILDGIIDVVAGEIDLPTVGTDWKAALRQNAISARNALLRHPWACNLWMSHRGDGPARLRHEEWMLRTLRAAGFSKELTYHAFHILESHLLGFALQQLSFPHKGEELAGLAADFLRQLPADEYPHFAEHVRQHLEPPEPRHGDEGGFELGLDLILDGLERVRDTAGSWASPPPARP